MFFFPPFLDSPNLNYRVKICPLIEWIFEAQTRVKENNKKKMYNANYVKMRLVRNFLREDEREKEREIASEHQLHEFPRCSEASLFAERLRERALWNLFKNAKGEGTEWKKRKKGKKRDKETLRSCKIPKRHGNTARPPLASRRVLVQSSFMERNKLEKKGTDPKKT